MDDESLETLEFSEEDKVRVEKLYGDLVDALERFRKNGVIEVPLAVMPLAAIMANMFVTLEQQGGLDAEELTIGFAKLIKHDIDMQRNIIPGGFGNA